MMNNKLPLRQKALYFVLSQISWFACVFLANSSLEVMSISVVLVNYLSAKKLFGKVDFKFAFKAVLAGLVFDQIALSSGIIRIPGLPILPLWLISLWLIFVLSLPIYQQVFAGKRLNAMIVGGIFGPLSYLAGQAFDILHFEQKWMIIIYVVFWAWYFSYFVASFKKSEAVVR